MKLYIFKNGIWLTFPPLLFSLSLMNHLPFALRPNQFNKGMPDLLINIENLLRILVFAMPAFFSIGVSTNIQKKGITLYLLGIVLYFLSYIALILFPESAWSLSLIGVAATAYTNIFWFIGLSMLGENFYLFSRVRYRPIYYYVPVIFFLIFHIEHVFIVYKSYYQ